MSPNPNETVGADGNGTTDVMERNWRIEQGIDAVNALRIEMRNAGLITCADALDEVFALCLQDYMALKENGEGAGPGNDGTGDDH